MNQETEKRTLLIDAMPSFAVELRQLLIEKGEPALAAAVPSLAIYDRCRCGGDACCATFYTMPKPNGSFGPGHRNVVLAPDEGMVILDVVGEQIACVEVLDRPEIREKLLRLLP